MSSMKKAFATMLAAALKDPADASYPLIVSPKIDGVRCVTMDWADGSNKCVPVSRSLKKIRNTYIYDTIAASCPPGLDGELIIGDLPGKTFCDSSAAISRFDQKPEFRYCVFDYVSDWQDPKWWKGVMSRYEDRLKSLSKLKLPDFCVIVPYMLVNDAKEFMTWHDTFVEQGFEGMCARTPHSPYKFGRSTLKECWLLKFKTFEDAEGVIVGFEELQHNANAYDDALQRRRTSHQANMVPMGTLGSLRVEREGVVFGVGTGFDEQTRQHIWDNRDKYLGKVVKYKHQPHGAKDKPRIPVFLGFREE